MASIEEQITQTHVPPMISDEINDLEIIDPEKQIEIVDGKVEIKEISGAKAGGVATRIAIELGIFLKNHKIGRVYGADTTFSIRENERMPDVSYVSSEKIPDEGEPFSKWDFAPDLAIEVISPSELFSNVQAKMHEYFEAGVKQVWIVSPFDNTVSIYNSPTEIRILTESEILTCEDILPGFELPLSEIFID